jgi:hypothetical protein
MTCKIERVVGPGGFIVFRVSGRIDKTYVDVFQQLTENEKTASPSFFTLDQLRVAPGR